MATDKERLGEILEEVADENKSIYIRRLEILQPIMATIGGLSMILVYAITGLYSIVPFSELFEKLMSRSEEHTSELQSLMRISYAVFCLKKKNHIQQQTTKHTTFTQNYDLHYR